MGVVSAPEAVMAAVERFDAAQAELAALSFDALTGPQALTVKDRLEVVARRQAAVDHRLTSHLQAQTSPAELGAKSWTEVLSQRLRISRDDARRRVSEAAELGPRITMTGQTLPPLWPTVAAAQADGRIGASMSG
jgi:hypothetical protein